MIVVKPHNFEFHYKIDCPYCDRVKKYLILPLEAIGFINVIHINTLALKGSASYMKNIRYESEISGRSEIAAPSLIDLSCKTEFNFFPVEKESSKKPSVKAAVKNMAQSLIDHLCRTVKIIDDEGRRKLIEVNDIANSRYGGLVVMAMEGY